jgi:tetratricopeptide (TPR) repeat protein
LGYALVVLTLVAATGSAAAHPAIDRQIADMNARIEARPDDPDLYVRRGELHRIHQDWAAAEADFKKARELDPERAAVDFLIGRTRLEAGAPGEAKGFLDRFLAVEPEHTGALVTRARALVALDRPLAAAKDYDRAIAALGEDGARPTHYLERARALASAGEEQLPRALRGLDEGLERLGQPVTLRLYAIELETEMGRYDAALARLDRIAAGAKRQESWLVQRGEILEAAGRTERARVAYGEALKAIDRLPDSRRGSRAVQRLAEQARSAIARLEKGN